MLNVLKKKKKKDKDVKYGRMYMGLKYFKVIVLNEYIFCDDFIG